MVTPGLQPFLAVYQVMFPLLLYSDIVTKNAVAVYQFTLGPGIYKPVNVYNHTYSMQLRCPTSMSMIELLLLLQPQ